MKIVDINMDPNDFVKTNIALMNVLERLFCTNWVRYKVCTLSMFLALVVCLNIRINN